MKRSTFLATAALSLAALLTPRKVKATAPAEVTPPTNKDACLVTETFTRDGAWRMDVKRQDELWEQVAVGHWHDSPPHTTLHVTCPHCQGRGFIQVPYFNHATGKGSMVDVDKCYYCHAEGTLLWGANWMGMHTEEGATALAQAITNHEYRENGHPNTHPYLWMMLENVAAKHPEVTMGTVRLLIFQELESRFSRHHAEGELARWESIYRER